MLTLRSLALVSILGWAGFAQAADAPGYTMDSAVTGMSTACADRYVLNRIKSRFAWAERNTWHRGFVMDSLENPRPSGHPYAEPGLIARDFCVAEAVMTNGDLRTVYYAVEHGVGFAGIGHYVDFCVLGLDPWHVHDGACRTVR
jgi:hypothetical protein